MKKLSSVDNQNLLTNAKQYLITRYGVYYYQSECDIWRKEFGAKLTYSTKGLWWDVYVEFTKQEDCVSFMLKFG